MEKPATAAVAAEVMPTMPTPPAAGYIPQRPCSATPEEEERLQNDTVAHSGTMAYAQHQQQPMRLEKQSSDDQEATNLRGGRGGRGEDEREKGGCCRCCMYCCGIVLLLQCLDCMC